MTTARIVFMGTPDFAVPSLESLIAWGGCDVVAVVTQPDRPVGRKRVLTPSPVKVAAEQHGIPVLQPERVRHPDVLDALQGLHPDLLVTAAYGQILPQRLLDIPLQGCLNVHASILPRWRGAAPIHRAIMAGDSVTGVTIMEMVQALDAGPIVGTVETAIDVNDDLGSLHDRLASLGAKALVRLLPDYLAGRLTPVAQPVAGITYAQRITRQDEYVTWDAPVNQVYNHIRGLSPWPVACGVCGGSVVKIWQVALVPDLYADGRVGTIRSFDDVGVCVRCQDGWLRLLSLVPAGKRRMSAEDWFRGLPDDPAFQQGASPA